jgi:hypothetical protein
MLENAQSSSTTLQDNQSTRPTPLPYEEITIQRVSIQPSEIQSPSNQNAGIEADDDEDNEEGTESNTSKKRKGRDITPYHRLTAAARIKRASVYLNRLVRVVIISQKYYE